ATSRMTMNCAVTIRARALQRRRGVSVCSWGIKQSLQSLVTSTIHERNAWSRYHIPRNGDDPDEDRSEDRGPLAGGARRLEPLPTQAARLRGKAALRRRL